jgi:glycerophosphoryl diester phosphodiesterase
MVKFGGHVEAFRQADNRQSDFYLVSYNEIKDLIFQNESTSKFVAAWSESLKASEDDYRTLRKALWDHIFKTVAERDPDHVRGANPGVALNLYAENMHPDKVQEVLSKMELLHRTATVNTEALRKLVKKHDKYCDKKLSQELLPILYTSSLYSSQNMLQDGIELVRRLLDESTEYSIATIVRHDSEAHHKHLVSVRMEELDWLKRMVASIPREDLLPRLVAHRGFHHIRDRNDKRPLENSLSAYEVAWTSGIHLCECDIAMTKDEKLVLAHDENFLRLALDSNDKNSHKHVSDLSFRELISIPLKNGVRPPLLIDVLRSACAISESSKLIIEIKPGNEAAASALARLLIRHVDLRQAVAMVMSFDAVTMHRLRSELAGAVEAGLGMMNTACNNTGMHHRVTSFDHFGTMLFSSHRRLNSVEKLTSSGSLGLSLSQNQFDTLPILEQEAVVDELLPGQSRPQSSMPKLMLLTVNHEPSRPFEQQLSISDLKPVESWLTMADGSLDGIYLQYESAMMTEDGAVALRKLSERYLVGVWTRSGKDPDDYNTFEWLVRRGNCTFVNSDLPNHFRKDVFVRTRSS